MADPRAALDGWFLQHGDSQKGPLSPTEIASLAERGELAGNQLVMHPNKTAGRWLTAKEALGIADAPVAPTPLAKPKPSAANVIAALASFFIPGLGQLALGRIPDAIIGMLAGVVAPIAAFYFREHFQPLIYVAILLWIGSAILTSIDAATDGRLTNFSRR